MSLETFDITPDITLMPKLGNSGYSLPQAIAELVDNSVDARIDGKLLEVNILIDKNSIIVSDNGKGMNKKSLVNALTLAHSEKKGQLGEFGLGLKTSCNSMGESFEIITTPNKDSQQYKVVFDQKEWLNGKRKWEIDVESTKSDSDQHFTIVKITKLFRHWPQLPEVLKKDLERRFTPFINRGLVNIKVNHKKCKPTEHELIDGSKKDFKIEINEGVLKGQTISGWYGLLKEGSNKGLYGFHTYRRGRMITTYDKIAIGEHPTISRIIGEINLDFLKPTHNKREFVKDEEYYAAENYLKDEFKELLKEARRASGQDKITKNVINELEVWQDKISQAIMESPELKSYTAQIDSKTGMTKDEDGIEEEVSSERRDSGSKSGTAISKDTDIERMPKKKNENRKKVIKIKGKKFEFDHEFASLGADSSWKDYEFNKEKRSLMIYTNTDFPAYVVTKDPIFYAVLHIAESISEVMVNEVGEEIGNIQEIKESILKIASNLKSQLD